MIGVVPIGFCALVDSMQFKNISPTGSDQDFSSLSYKQLL